MLKKVCAYTAQKYLKCQSIREIGVHLALKLFSCFTWKNYIETKYFQYHGIWFSFSVTLLLNLFLFWANAFNSFKMQNYAFLRKCSHPHWIIMYLNFYEKVNTTHKYFVFVIFIFFCWLFYIKWLKNFNANIVGNVRFLKMRGVHNVLILWNKTTNNSEAYKNTIKFLSNGS